LYFIKGTTNFDSNVDINNRKENNQNNNNCFSREHEESQGKELFHPVFLGLLVYFWTIVFVWFSSAKSMLRFPVEVCQIKCPFFSHHCLCAERNSSCAVARENYS